MLVLFVFSFTALEYCIRSNVLSRFIDDPTILYRAALIGPLRAASIESFAAKRTDEFRKKCREVLLLVEKLSKSSEEWESAIGKSISSLSGVVCDIYELRLN